MTQKEIQNVLFEAFQERKRVEIEYKEHDGTTSQAVTPVDAILFYDRGLPSCFRSGTHTIFLKHIISVRIPPEEVLVNVGDYVQFTHRCKDWIVKTVMAGEAAWLIDINTGFTWAGPITSRELGTTEFDILPYLSEGETNVRIIKVEHKVLPKP